MPTVISRRLSHNCCLRRLEHTCKIAKVPAYCRCILQEPTKKKSCSLGALKHVHISESRPVVAQPAAQGCMCIFYAIQLNAWLTSGIGMLVIQSLRWSHLYGTWPYLSMFVGANGQGLSCLSQKQSSINSSTGTVVCSSSNHALCFP